MKSGRRDKVKGTAWCMTCSRERKIEIVQGQRGPHSIRVGYQAEKALRRHADHRTTLRRILEYRLDVLDRVAAISSDDMDVAEAADLAARRKPA